MNDKIIENQVLHKVLNSKKYDWDRKINYYGTDITILAKSYTEIRDKTTKKFVAMMLHDEQANKFIRRNGYIILATSLSYSEVLDRLLESKTINDRVLNLTYLKRFLDMNDVIKHILKVCNNEVIYNKYFRWNNDYE